MGVSLAMVNGALKKLQQFDETFPKFQSIKDYAPIMVEHTISAGFIFFIFCAMAIASHQSGLVYPDVELSGAAYNETSLLMRRDSQSANLNHGESLRYGNRSALHLKAVSQSEGVKAVSELEFYTIYGYLSSFMPGISESLKDGQFYIDRLYLKFPVYNVDTTLGKQRIAWGSGVVFRPTDRFNKPNPLSLSGRKEGINALLTKTHIGDLSSIELVVAPADVYQKIDDEISLEHLKYSKFASRFLTNQFKSDMAVSCQYDGVTESYIFGIDMKGDIKFGYHIEAILMYDRDTYKDKDLLCQTVFGVDYSFWSKLFFLSEYFYNGSGLEKKTRLSGSQFLLLDEFKYRHYLYCQILYQHDVFLSANLFALWNMLDRSLILSPGINYSLFQNTDLQVYSQIFLGDEADEYGPDRLGVDQIYYVKLRVKF